MLRFAVFDENGPATDFELVNAYLLGPDDVAIPGQVSFEDGEVRCETRATKATGLALQFDAGGAGTLILQTCLLPESERPYVLTHELARHRIKFFLVKCEEWQMFEIDTEHPAFALWEEARQLFTKGLNETNPVKMDKYGRASLQRAIEATERLAMAHAEILLHRRYSTKPGSRTTLGVRVSPTVPPARHLELIQREFDLLYVPLIWRDLEKAEGEYDWSGVDAWMATAQKLGKPVIAGPLLDFSQRAVPEFIYVWQHDYETTRDLVYDHMERVVRRYHKVVTMWSIASGLNVNDNFQFTEQQMLDLTRMANLFIRQELRGRTMIEVTHPFGEFIARQRDALPALSYIDRMVQEGIRVNAYGIQLAFGSGPGAIEMRDLMQMSDLLDRYFMLETPVLLTSVGVPSEPGSNPDAGRWRRPWSEEVQADWNARAFPLSMSKPHVESFICAALQDHTEMDVEFAGVIDASNQPKPGLKRLIDMRRRLRKPLGAMRNATRKSAPSSP